MQIDIPELRHLCLLTYENTEKFVQCNAEAYIGYSLMDYLAGRADPNYIYWLWHANMHSLAKGAIAFADSEEVKGLMVWMPPSIGVVDDLRFLWYGGMRFLPKLWRLIRTENYSTSLKNIYTDKNTWYLFDFAISPAYQHQHVAS